MFPQFPLIFPQCFVTNIICCIPSMFHYYYFMLYSINLFPFEITQHFRPVFCGTASLARTPGDMSDMERCPNYIINVFH